MIKSLHILILALALTASAGAAPSQPPSEGSIDWSPIVDGLKARLVITDVNNQGKPSNVRTDGDKTFFVYIEIQNVGFRLRKLALNSPYFKTNKEFEISLSDCNGAPVPRRTDVINMYNIMVNIRWLEIPVDSTVRFPISSGYFEVVPSSGALSVSLDMDQPWLLSWNQSQGYFLSCILKPAEALAESMAVGDKNSLIPPLVESYETWKGVLSLPPVRIPVRNR